MIDLSGKHILITGGDIALIRGIIRRLQVANAKTTLGLHRRDWLKQISDEFGCDTLPLSWEHMDKVELQFERIAKVDGIIICPNCQPKPERFVDSKPLEWDDVIAVNYEAAVYLSQAAAKHMIKNKVAGSIIFLTSVATLMPFVDTSLYGTSLAMLRPLAKMAAVDCGQYGIRVNMIAMGWIESEFTQPYLTDDGKAFIERGIPVGQVGTPQAIGDTCCFLLSDLSQYMTGSVLTVDGGYTLTRSEGQSPYPETHD